MSAREQLQLCTAAVDERRLDDVSRTILEAIDHLGSITARQAGSIVYRFRGYELVVSVPGTWLAHAGRRVLARLEHGGHVRRRRSRWLRATRQALA